MFGLVFYTKCITSPSYQTKEQIVERLAAEVKAVLTSKSHVRRFAIGPLTVAVDLDLLDVSIHAPFANYSYHPNGRRVRKGVPKYIIFEVPHESATNQVYWSQGGT